MLTARRARGRAGMTLMEGLITLAIVLLLAGTILPEVMSRLGQGQGAALVTNIDGFKDAIAAFRSDTGRYPQRLSQLSTPLRSSSRDLCGNLIPDSSVWQGPYIDRTIDPAAGFVVGGAVIADSLRRSPANVSPSSRFGTLTIVATGVEQAVATDLEGAVDGNANLATGTLQWSATGGGVGELRYGVPIRGC